MIGDRNIKRINQNNQGFSLVEMLVAVAIFTILIVAALSIFQSVVKSQHNAMAAQSVQESMRFALEMISKELRSAKRITNDDDCVVGAVGFNKVYNFYNDPVDGPSLSILNRHNECVFYYISSNNRLVIERNGTALEVTPDEVIISDFNVDIIDDLVGAFHTTQPKITIKMKAEILDPTNKNEMKIQTTISSRYYE